MILERGAPAGRRQPGPAGMPAVSLRLPGSAAGLRRCPTRMHLTLAEAATLTGLAPRTLRAQAQASRVRAVKVEGRWRFRRDDLPLTPAASAERDRRTDGVQAAVRAALPARRSERMGGRGRTLLDFDAWRDLRGLLPEVVERCPEAGPAVRRALVALAEAAWLFHPAEKLVAVGRARAALAEATTALHLAPGGEPLALRLEREVVGAVGGYARWVENLRRPGA